MALSPEEACCKRCNQIRLRADLVDGYCRRCASYPKTVLCRRCGEHVSKRDMYGVYCRWCVTVTREHVCEDCGEAFTTTTYQARSRRYCDRCIETHRKQPLKKSLRYLNYGITEHHLHTMYDHQRGQCPICLRYFSLDDMYIDHDHDTGQVRGLLCNPCNTGLGMFKDDSKRFERAIEYLRQPPALDAFDTLAVKQQSLLMPRRNEE